MTNLITATEYDGTVYFETVANGVEYCAHASEATGGWVVASRRTKRTGTVKHFASVEEVSAKVKALDGLALLLSAPAVPN